MKPILINLDLKTNSYEDIELKQGCQDTLIATITDLGDNVDLTGQVISVEMLKGDNTFIIQTNDITVSENKITVILNKDLTRVSGKGKLQIKMTKNNVISGSWVVSARIKSGAIDSAIGESGNIVTIKEELDKSIIKAEEENKKTQDLIQNGGAATKVELAEVRSDLGEKVNKVDIVNNLNVGGINKVLSAEQGKIIGTSLGDIKKANEAMHVPCVALISGNIIIVDLGQQLTTGNYLISISFNHNPSGSPSYVSTFTGIIHCKRGYSTQLVDTISYTHIGKDMGVGTSNMADLRICWAYTDNEYKAINIVSSVHIQITKGSPSTNISDFQFKINCVKLNNL